MAISWSKILELAPRFLMGLLPGLSGAGLGGRFASSTASRILAGSGMKGAAFDYPEFNDPKLGYMPLPDEFWYTVDNVADQNKTYIGGKNTVLPAMNGETMDRETVNAALAQSLQEHNRAVQRGNEPDLIEWWPGQDRRPRRELHPKSTAISGLKITKGGNIQIQWKNGNGKWYTYRGGDDIRQTTEFVKDLMTYPSIGRALNRKGQLAWPNSKHLNADGKVDDSLGRPDGNLGKWGTAHYAEDWASLQ